MFAKWWQTSQDTLCAGTGEPAQHHLHWWGGCLVWLTQREWVRVCQAHQDGVPGADARCWQWQQRRPCPGSHQHPLDPGCCHQEKVSASVQDGVCGHGKAHMCSTLSLQSFPSIALESSMDKLERLQCSYKMLLVGVEITFCTTMCKRRFLSLFVSVDKLDRVTRSSVLVWQLLSVSPCRCEWVWTSWTGLQDIVCCKSFQLVHTCTQIPFVELQFVSMHLSFF